MSIKGISETYATISFDDLSKVDFNQVGETSANTIRQSLDLTKFLIKWDITPTFIEDKTITPIQTMNHEQAIILMSSIEWEIPIPDPEDED